MAGFGRVSAHIISQLGPGSLTGAGAGAGAGTRKLKDDCSFRSEEGWNMKMTQTDRQSFHLVVCNLGNHSQNINYALLRSESTVGK